jgi:hypothetical protein
MAQPQYALVNWWMEALKSGQRKVGDTFECRQGGKLPVTPEELGCSTHGSLYNLMQLMTKAGLFTRAGDGHLAVSDLWEAIETPDDAIDIMKKSRVIPALRNPVTQRELDLIQSAPEPDPEPLHFNLFEVLDQLTDSERVTCILALAQSLVVRGPELERSQQEMREWYERREAEYERTIASHQAEMERIRLELKNERANVMLLRQELESKRVSVARTIEKIITVDSGKSTPTSGDWGNAGGKRIGAASGPKVIMHRKGAMAHVPKVVREHLQNGHAKDSQ